MRQLVPAVLFVTCLCAMALLRWGWPLLIFLYPPLTWAGMLLKKFGHEFHDYCRKTRRWV